jgi:LmbE family N-acetylglucosaminyl deacetylase
MMRSCGIRRAALAALVVGLLAIGSSHVRAQSMEGTGLVPTGLLLRQMDGVKRVLMIGAHPDDEDTSLLTSMARGWGAETAYLALTRGDGGQNLIGPELWEGLGVIRTGELETARALDGGRQFFTRAFDFGYSKSVEEAFTLWPREELLHDVVWVVRRFRPHVIVSVFSGTPRDGHGQHQVAGIMAREVFEAAGNPTRFPEQLERGFEPWAPAKLYESARRRFGGSTPTDAASVVVETGAYDPLIGRSHFQLSMESRSQHRSQGMGAPQPAGPSTTGASFVASYVGGAENEMFSGIDTTLVGLTAGMDAEDVAEASVHLEAYRASVARARDKLGLNLFAIAPHLGEALRHLEAVTDGHGGNTEFSRALEQKRHVVTRAFMAAAGIDFEFRALDDLLVPGQTVRLRAQLWNGGRATLRGAQVEVTSEERADWPITELSVEGLAGDGSVAPESLVTWTFELSIPEDAALSRLYFLREVRQGAMYRWPDGPGLSRWLGLPRDGPVFSARLRFIPHLDDTAIGTRTAIVVPMRYVGTDQVKGEFEKPVLIVPAVSVAVTPGGVVWPQGQLDARTITVSLRSEADEGGSGEVRLQAPEGWTVSPTSRPFELASAGAQRSVSFEIRAGPSVTAGEHVFQAVARVGGQAYDEGFTLIDYEHIERSAMFADAEARVTVVPVAVRDGLKVGYIMGTGDDGPTAIRQMGASVELLTEVQVRDGAFSDYDVVVLGVRAYEARADVRAANDQLLDFARSGGTVINQYNQYQFSNGGYAPYGLTIGRPAPRVADETAAIAILEPDAPLFTTPNRITQADFDGWVQERGLYFASEWGDEYLPMLELNDPGEPARRGSLLVAPVGDGVYVYTGLSFFRQWAGRVPGAYRLFANLVSLEAGDWAAFAAGR